MPWAAKKARARQKKPIVVEAFALRVPRPWARHASSRWDASDLLDVQVDHVARETSQDRFADPVGLSSGAWCRAVGSDRLCPAIGSRYAPTPLSRAQPARG